MSGSPCDIALRAIRLQILDHLSHAMLQFYETLVSRYPPVPSDTGKKIEYLLSSADNSCCMSDKKLAADVAFHINFHKKKINNIFPNNK